MSWSAAPATAWRLVLLKDRVVSAASYPVWPMMTKNEAEGLGLFYIVLIVVGPDEWLSGLSLTFETYGATSDKGDMMGMRLDFKRTFPAKSHGSNVKEPRPSA